MNDKERIYIPIKKRNNSQSQMWYMDITDANISELIELKNCLIGYNNDAVVILDKLINQYAGISGVKAKMNKREEQLLKGNMHKRSKYIKKLKRG